jgi:hypothetical protein
LRVSRVLGVIEFPRHKAPRKTLVR